MQDTPQAQWTYCGAVCTGKGHVGDDGLSVAVWITGEIIPTFRIIEQSGVAASFWSLK